MADDAVARPARPLAYIAIHDKTPVMRVLYASSSIRHILQFAPSDVVGQPALAFVNNVKATDYSEQFGRLTNDTVLASHMLVDNRQGTPVHLRIIHFSCDNLEFNVALAVPRAPRPPEAWAMHPVNPSRAVQACLVLESPTTAERFSSSGPRVVFASRSAERVVRVAVEDVQGVGFLELLAPEDVTSAAKFLERVAESASVEYIVLRFGVTDAVAVEVLAAGSDDGALLLCRATPADGSRDGGGDGDGYMSLDEIISSDAETSDISSIWRSLR
ncbi:hypothetical protein LPJ73_001934 [Coemansia sp. RSA 2703]|nr:hypothetical protein LPJ73_001934 [Coemansia sp. RSA 2703]